jgi:hypothetical protein
MVPSDLQVLEPSDFHRPELMAESFVRWLDAVCAHAGIDPIITDDGRLAEDPNPTGSARKHSLHRRGRAVDLRSRIWTPAQKWRLNAAIVELADTAPGKVEFEPVYSPTDQHWHVGVDEMATAHRFLEADE